MRRLILALLLLALLIGCQSATAQATKPYVYGTAPNGWVITARSTDGAIEAKFTSEYENWGGYLTAGKTYDLSALGGCVLGVPQGATESMCAARFELKNSPAEYGPFVIGPMNTPTPEPTATATSKATATPTPVTTATPAGSTLYICNHVLHLEVVEVDGRLTAVVVCREGEVQ